MAYDAAREEIVMFGGASNRANESTFSPETWIYRGVSIRPQTPDPRKPEMNETVGTFIPLFEWSQFQAGGDGQLQSGFQLRVVRDTGGEAVVYDTGFINNPTGNQHVYSPGSYAGYDTVSATTRVSNVLENGKQYHWHIRYQDAGGHWSLWSADDPNPHRFFSTPSYVELLSISGRIQTSALTTISDALVSAGNFGGNSTTGTDGHYDLTVPFGWSGTITVTKPYWSFNSQALPPVYLAQTVNFIGTPQQLSGDANGDGKVNVSDLGILATNYGVTSGATWGMGDFTGDGKVNVSDLGILATNYGFGMGQSLDITKDMKTLGLSVGGDGVDPGVTQNSPGEVQGPPENSRKTDPLEEENSVAKSVGGCGSAGLSLITGLFLMGVVLVKVEE